MVLPQHFPGRPFVHAYRSRIHFNDVELVVDTAKPFGHAGQDLVPAVALAPHRFLAAVTVKKQGDGAGADVGQPHFAFGGTMALPEVNGQHAQRFMVGVVGQLPQAPK